MKWTTGAVVAAVVPGGVVVAGGVMFATLYGAMRTGIADLDRWRIRGSALLALLMVFRLGLTEKVARGFMAILHNEGAYTPKADGTYPLGDLGVRLGPSVGPGQVLSGLNLARLGYQGDPLDLAKVGNEVRALYYAARIYAEALAEKGGDVDAAQVRYNGSGAAAVAYGQRTDAFEVAEGWDVT